jgi:hypothetical protein
VSTEQTPPIFGKPRPIENYGDTPQGARQRVLDLPNGVSIEYRPYLQSWCFVLMYELRPAFEVFSPELGPGIAEFESGVQHFKAFAAAIS